MLLHTLPHRRRRETTAMRPGKECLLSILVELCAVLLIAVLTPWLIRYLLLPTAVHHQYPLNVVFHTCDHDLHSVCSFPTATLEYEKNSLFSPNVAYYLNIRLKFADVANSKMLGLFQNVITMSDESGNTLKQYTRSAYTKDPGMVVKASQVFFFPLYFLGFFHDYSTLTIPMCADYLETAERPSTKIVFTIQDKFANIEDAELIVTARFGLIRHLLYYWPSFSFAAIFLFVFFLGAILITFKLAYQSYSARSKAILEKEKAEILKKKPKIEVDVKKEIEEPTQEVKNVAEAESAVESTTAVRKRK